MAKPAAPGPAVLPDRQQAVSAKGGGRGWGATAFSPPEPPRLLPEGWPEGRAQTRRHRHAHSLQPRRLGRPCQLCQAESPPVPPAAPRSHAAFKRVPTLQSQAPCALHERGAFLLRPRGIPAVITTRTSPSSVAWQAHPGISAALRDDLLNHIYCKTFAPLFLRGRKSR